MKVRARAKVSGQYAANGRHNMISRLRSTLHRLTTVASAVLLLAGCGSDTTSPDQEQADRCDAIISALTACYPDLATEATCTAETLAMYDSHDVENLSCDLMDDMGKADVFAFGGCEAGEHVCGFIFCCGDYEITQDPTELEWDIVGLVQEYQADTPADVVEEQSSITDTELSKGISWTWEQDVVEELGGAPRPMAVELSQRVLPIAYDEFVEKLAPQDWGTHLAYYIGGEVRVVEEDGQGRATRQIERMVLSPLPCDMDMRLGNNDMTKAEVIEYGEDWARVNWRVYHSDNNSTEADVGSVAFEAFGQGTLVTFYSAHRLNAPLGIHIDNAIVQLVLKTYFLDHIEAYRRVVM